MGETSCSFIDCADVGTVGKLTHQVPEIIRKYRDEGVSIVALGRAYGVSHAAIYYHLIHAGVVRTQKHGPKTRSMAISMKRSGAREEDICRQLRIGRSTLHAWLKALGRPRKTLAGYTGPCTRGTGRTCELATPRPRMVDDWCRPCWLRRARGKERAPVELADLLLATAQKIQAQEMALVWTAAVIVSMGHSQRKKKVTGYFLLREETEQ